ncbi:patatin-like phospholipase domain-containing protein 2 [Cyclopterus lumpus]|uniref:patatin-like phospholipase domain-containing protein 2 n=1 Tax=Cyclopterus lumpus TaxID=8103 RepID=UPI001486114A|nr:patatin-like phospholipase domain-containing protein 2 [Cyclopterus lumpus]
MFDLQKEWSISFAGCGFMGIYYVGASSCILERFPRFIRGASKIYGASAGALMAAVLTVGAPLEVCCADLMFMAKEGRKHKLGPLHPAFNLMGLVKDSLQRCLPEDAHVRASGKLHVSLTRVSDRKNILVSEFDSREELIQVLVCSCFVPFYCGVIPPTYRGVHYVDGAVSDNLPQCHQKNTTTFSPYAGESDLCPRASTRNFHQVRFSNVSIQVNSDNMYRVTSTFFPPQPEAMAEICQTGYADALRFLQENNLISSECPLRSLETDAPGPAPGPAPRPAHGHACCEPKVEVEEPAEDEESKNAVQTHEEEHRWLDPRLIENLPVHIQKALCEACRETQTAGGLLSYMTSYLQIPRPRPVESAYSLAKRLVDWIPGVSRDVGRLYGMAGDVYKQAWKDNVKDNVKDGDSEPSLRGSTSLSFGLDLLNQSDEDLNDLPVTPGATPSSGLGLTWNTQDLDHMPPTPPLTPTDSPASGFGDAPAESPKGPGRGWGSGRAVGWIRNAASEQTSDLGETGDSAFE